MLKAILRKLRGALGTAVTWAVAWAIAGFALFGILFLLSPGLTGFWDAATPLTLLAGASGFVGGTVFSTVLGTIHRRRRLEELSPLRMGLWGAMAGLLLPLSLLGVGLVAGVPLEAGVVGTLLLAFGGLGGVTAGGTIKLAQQDQKEIGGGSGFKGLGPGE